MEQKHYVVFYYPEQNSKTYYYHRGTFLETNKDFDYTKFYFIDFDMDMSALCAEDCILKMLLKKEIEIEEWDAYNALDIAEPNMRAFRFITKVSDQIIKQSHAYCIFDINPEDLIFDTEDDI